MLPGGGVLMGGGMLPGGGVYSQVGRCAPRWQVCSQVGGAFFILLFIYFIYFYFIFFEFFFLKFFFEFFLPFFAFFAFFLPFFDFSFCFLWGPPPSREADSGIWSTSGRYASYWNAFLFILFSVTIIYKAH